MAFTAFQQSLAQRAPTRLSGDILENYQNEIDAGRLLSTSVNTFIPRTAIKIDSNNKGQLVFEKAAATDNIYGFIIRDLKDGDNLSPTDSISSQVSVLKKGRMYMVAGALINAGAKLEIVAASNKVITSAGTNTVIGIAIESASADGSIILVEVQ